MEALQEFAAGAKAAACKILVDYGIGAAVLTRVALSPNPYSLGAAAVGSVALWAFENECNWDTDKPSPDGCQPNFCGCVEVEKTLGGQLKYKDGEGRTYSAATTTGGSVYCQKLLSVDVSYNPGINTEVRYEVRGESKQHDIRNPAGPQPHCYFLQGSTQSGQCVNSCGGDQPPPQPDTYVHTTEEGCEINVDFLAWGDTPDGRTAPIFKMTPGQSTRAAGSVVGGCNFMPVVHYNGAGSGGGGGGGDNINVTVNYYEGDDDNGKPFWQDMLEKALPVVMGNLIAGSVKAIAGEVLKAKLPAAEFEFVAPCNYKEDGTQESIIYQLPLQDYQSRVVSQQAVIMEILQQHLNWKTPICWGNDQAGTYWRSITFESTTYSDNSNSRLVKRFRYRSNSPGDVRQLAAHWAGFSWNTGPVIVKHTGSALGSPQVWAASADEGQRVIQHAGREAGVDPNQAGEWSISSTDSPRYGVQRTVVLKQVDGCWMATSRQGPEGWPEAAIVTPDP